MPCTKGVSNSFSRYYGFRCGTLKASQHFESSGSPITASCVGDRQTDRQGPAYSLQRLQYVLEGRAGVGLKTSLVPVCHAEREKHVSCALKYHPLPLGSIHPNSFAEVSLVHSPYGTFLLSSALSPLIKTYPRC